MPDVNAPFTLTEEQHRAIRHMPMVVDHCAEKAQDMLAIVNQLCSAELTSPRWQKRSKTGHFGFLLSDEPDHTRPRAYIHPVDGYGIRIEMTHHVLLKAAAAMGGK